MKLDELSEKTEIMKNTIKYLSSSCMIIAVTVLSLLSSCTLEDLFASHSQTTGLSIGDFHEGGVIFYLDDTGQHGLVCAIEDQSDETVWGCFQRETIGADGVTIGTGLQNSIDIVNDTTCNASGGRYDWAPDLCLGLTLNGHEDWFLPSQNELNEMYLNKIIIDSTAMANGGTAFVDFEEFLYWNSSEFNGVVSNGGCQSFKDGEVPGACGKNGINMVRAVRAFY